MHTFCRGSGKFGKYFKRDHVTSLLKHLESINLINVQVNESSHMYQTLNGAADSNVKKINFDFRNTMSQRISRNVSDLNADYRRTATGQRLSQ